MIAAAAIIDKQNQTNLFQVLQQQPPILQPVFAADLNDVYAVYKSITWLRFFFFFVVFVFIVWMFGIIYRSSLNSDRFERWTSQAGINFAKNYIIYIHPCPSLFVSRLFLFLQKQQNDFFQLFNGFVHWAYIEHTCCYADKLLDRDIRFAKLDDLNLD